LAETFEYHFKGTFRVVISQMPCHKTHEEHELLFGLTVEK